MGAPAAKQGDRVVGMDIHIILIQSGPVTTPTPLPHPFAGMLASGLSTDVKIMGKPAATVGSMAANSPSHIPQGGPFQRPPTNQGTVTKGSATVTINGKPAARTGDAVVTCNDPADLPNGTIIAVGTVMIG